MSFASLVSRKLEVVLDLLERIRETSGTALLLVTHDPAVAARSDRIVRMLDGRIDPITQNRRAARPSAVALSTT